MQPQQPAASAQGRRKKFDWRIALSCLGVLSLTSAAIASIVLFAWVALAKTEPFPFPASALLGFVPALASIGVGTWAWRTKKVWWLAAVTAIAGGGLGLAFALGYVAFGLLVLRST